MADFTSHIDGELLYQTATTLAVPGLAHGFSTRLGGVSRGIFSSMNLGVRRGDDPDAVAENYRRFCGAIGVDPRQTVFSRQVHRADVRTVTAADAGDGLLRPCDLEFDAMVTNVPEMVLVVFSADCIPTLYFDPVTRCIGAAHAGWRGTALGIAEKTIQAMHLKYGAKPENIRAAIGPGISQCCFETTADVPQAMDAALGSASAPYLHADGGGKWHVDLKGLNRLWMLRAGVAAENIAVSSDCTACDNALYWSHRRVGEGRGSQAAMISLR